MKKHLIYENVEKDLSHFFGFYVGFPSGFNAFFTWVLRLLLILGRQICPSTFRTENKLMMFSISSAGASFLFYV